jgi:hypothetical protein
MKLRYMILAVPVFVSYGSFTYAATKGMDHDDSYAQHGLNEKRGHGGSYQEDNRYDFDDRIKELVGNHHHNHNVYLRMCRYEEDDHDYGHDGHGGHDGEWGGGHNEVPVPAAFWLFAPSLMGLLGIKRKKPQYG